MSYKRNRNLLIVLLSMILALTGLTGCEDKPMPSPASQMKTFSETQEPSETPTTAVGATTVSTPSSLSIGPVEYHIGLIMAGGSDPYLSKVEEGVAREARLQGVKLTVLDSQNDVAKERAGIARLVDLGVDCILFCPSDATDSRRALEPAVQANIPFITLVQWLSTKDEDALTIAHVDTDDVASGEMAARYLLNELDGEGAVVVLEGIADAANSVRRSEGFERAIEGSNLLIAHAVAADFDRATALALTKNLLMDQVDVQAIFAHNDEMALGAMVACAELGREDIRIVGCDGSSAARKAVADGTLAATIAKRPEEIGVQGIRSALSYLRGELSDAVVLVAPELVAEPVAGAN